jgi:hypothetical protein
MSDFLEIALRVHTEQIGKKSENRRAVGPVGTAPRWLEWVLIVDTETRIDKAQDLTFGSARLARWKPDATLECMHEYLFHTDDLEKSSPHEFEVLKTYARAHRKEHRLTLMSRRQFLEEVWRLIKANTLIIGFNLPFDISRLAVNWTEGRGRFAKGFSFILWESVDKRTGKRMENRHRPRLRVKHLDSARALMDIASSGADVIRAKLLDLRTLTFALTNKRHSLASACGAFSTAHGKDTPKRHGLITADYIDYNRRDVLATQELLEKLRTEFEKHPIDLDPTNAMSLRRSPKLISGRWV